MDLERGEDLGEQVHAREGLLLVHAYRHLPRLDSCLDQLGGDPQALGIRARVPEASRVGKDAGIDALRGVLGEGPAQRADDLVREDAYRGGVRIDVVHVPERLRRDVMIQVEEHAAAIRLRDVGPQPVESACVGHHRDVEGGARGQRLRHLGRSAQEAEVVRQIVGIVDGHFAAEIPQRGRQRQGRSERVAVGAAVHGDQDRARGPQRVDRQRQVLLGLPVARVRDAEVDRLHSSRSGRNGSGCCVRSSSCTCLRSCSMRSPRSMASS